MTVFDDILADMLNNKKCHHIVTELFIWGGKLKISLVFITQSHVAVPTNTVESVYDKKSWDHTKVVVLDKCSSNKTPL